MNASNSKIELSPDDVVVVCDGVNMWVSYKADVFKALRSTSLHRRKMTSDEYTQFCDDAGCLIDQSNSCNVTGRDPYDVIPELIDAGADVLHID